MNITDASVIEIPSALNAFKFAVTLLIVGFFIRITAAYFAGTAFGEALAFIY